jgi:hypothetical protein
VKGGADEWWVAGGKWYVSGGWKNIFIKVKLFRICCVKGYEQQ